ncbi:galactose oxidase, partial [Rhizophagus irregularis]
MRLFNKLIRILGIILYLISYHINVINCQQYVPMKRSFHTATLVGNKIYFLGGFTDFANYTNDFFTLDVSKSFNQSEGIPYEDLNYLSTGVPEHNRATTSVGGESKDTIFLFDGHMGNYTDYASEVVQSFSTSEKIWQTVTTNVGKEPMRRTSSNAATDSNGKAYLFGGAKELRPIQYYNVMNTFDTINKVWFSINFDGIASAPTPRDGYTATFIPETSSIIYIGGFGKSSDPFTAAGLINIGNLDIYDTINNNWRQQSTSDPPSSRVFHTAVLTKDRRIILFGGADYTTKHPADSYYEVLNVNTYEWYHSNKDTYLGAPYKGHTATLVDDYMFISFGFAYTKHGTARSDEILIYKIGENADFDLVESFERPIIDNHSHSSDTKITTIQIIAISFGTIGFVAFMVALFIVFRKYPKKKNDILFIE